MTRRIHIHKKNRTVILLSIILFLATVYLITNVILSFSSKHTPSMNSRAGAAIIPTPLPAPLSSRGMYVYQTRSGEPIDPAFEGGNFGPVDAVKGKKQSFEIYITSTNPIKSAVMKLRTDHATKILPLVKNIRNGQKEIWKTDWILDDSTDYVYTVHTEITTENDERNENDLAFR